MDMTCKTIQRDARLAADAGFRHVLHYVAGLAVEVRAELFQRVSGNMLAFGKFSQRVRGKAHLISQVGFAHAVLGKQYKKRFVRYAHVCIVEHFRLPSQEKKCVFLHLPLDKQVQIWQY